MRKNKMYTSPMRLPQMMISSAIILQLISSLNSQTMSRPGRTTAVPIDLILQSKLEDIETDINVLRDIHGVNRVHMKIDLNNWSFTQAQHYLETGRLNGSSSTENPESASGPTRYFPLVASFVLDDVQKFMRDRDFNPVYDWYGSRRFYPGKYDKSSHPEYGFYTQMIWKNSTDIGIGYAYAQTETKQLLLHVVVNFRPPGNDPFTFEENITPTKYPMPDGIDDYGR